MKRRQGSGVAMVIIALISGLWSGWAVSQAAREEAKPANGEVRYPPYPEVWEHRFHPKDQTGGYYLMPNGDVLIVGGGYRDAQGTHMGEFTWAHYQFFERKDFPVPNPMAFPYPGYTQISPLHTKPMELADGNLVYSDTLGSGAKCSNEFNPYVLVKDRQGQVVRRFRILFLLDEPIYDEGSDCEGDEPREVKAISCNRDFIPLKDGTFLSACAHLVVRFRQDFSTGSKWLNERLFIVGMEVDPYRELGWNPDWRNGPVATQQEVWVAYLTKLQGEGR